jgi:F-type H+-transporting ATPase subunit epsilon
MATGLHVRVVSPERVVFEGHAASLVVPAWDGKVGILRDHAPLITLLGSGQVMIRGARGEPRRFFVSGGVLKVQHNEAILLTEFAGDDPPPDWHPVHLELDEEIARATAGAAT